MKTLFYKNISQKGYNKYTTIIKFLNLKHDLFSLLDATKYIQDTVLTYHTHKRCDNNINYNYSNWSSEKINNVYFMNQPTNESWLNLWVEYLQEKGLKIYFNFRKRVFIPFLRKKSVCIKFNV